METTTEEQREDSKAKGRVIGTVIAVVLLVLYFAFRPTIDVWFGIAAEPAGNKPTEVKGPDAKSVSQRTGPERAEPRVAEPQRSTGKATFAGLKDIGRNVKLSPAGLRYGPGSQEGHRLKHVLRHDNDIPSRPSRHGVFDGDSDDLLAAIDEAYSQIKYNSPRVRTERQRGRTVHEINMGRRIGFVGGQVGRQRGHPAATHIRLVLEGTNVITAFPYRP